MKAVRIASWSNVLPTRTHLADGSADLRNRLRVLDRPFIPRGAGRSLGDAAYVTDGVTFLSRSLQGIVEFDEREGTIVCEPGVQMVDLFNYLDRSAWTLPVGGGTRWVTIGGAVAADIHGKNDVRQGSFGNHVEALRLVTADAQEFECSKRTHPELFAATIGGMGLTGFITRIKLRLFRAPSNVVEERVEPFSTVEEMQERFARTSDFQVAWIDLTTSRWRGLYHAASYASGRIDDCHNPIEFEFPAIRMFNRPFVRLLNAARYAHHANVTRTTHIMNIHYPVDLLKHWNKLYGPRGFHEYQFLVSEEVMPAALTRFIEESRRFSLSPFFVVVKRFGSMPREGLLSFPRAGFTLMADFENRRENQAFFRSFTEFLLEAGGRIYLAKDSSMTRQQFERMYDTVPVWRSIVKRFDPGNKIQSDLSIRLGMKPW